MTDFVAQTERLAGKVADPVSRNFFIQQQYANGKGEYPNNPLTFQESVAFATAIVVDGYLFNLDSGVLQTPDQEIEYLDEWRRSLRDQCSERYQQIMAEGLTEGLTREDLNRDDRLIILNSIRLGIGMRVNWMHSERQRRAGRDLAAA